MSSEILVIGGNHHNTLSILRSLGEKGVQSQLIIVSTEPKPYVSYSKYINSCIVVDNLDEISEAMYLLRKKSDKAVVIACSDGISSYLDSHRDILSKDFILPGAQYQGAITHLMNKDVMLKLAAESGMSVPKSWIVSIQNPQISSIEYPCIIKPLVSKNGSKTDIEICKNKDHLLSYLSNCHCEQLQIQEYILKDLEFQLIGCSLDEGKQIIIPGVSVILRQPKNTNTGFLRYLPRGKFNFNEDVCKKFIEKTGYSGLFSLEFLRDTNGIDYFMEINFRNDGNSICVTASGLNLPFIWYLHSSNSTIKDELKYNKMKEVLVMPEFEDFNHVKTREISIFEWVKDVIKTDRFMEFDKHDQKPFWVQLFKIITSKIKWNLK